MDPAIHFEADGPQARIVIDRPPLNVLSTSMLRAVSGALDRACADDGIRVVRLEARGKLFSAGVDVADHVEGRLDAMMAALVELFEKLDAAPVVTVAVVHGAALGGGCELALGTDLCFASERASFGQPEIRLGLFAPPASVLLPRLVGERRALELLLGGATIPAVEAERIGLVNAVFPADRFEAQVAERLDGLLGLSGAALRLAKRAVRVARGLPVAAAHHEVNRLYLDELMQTEDADEGMQAFIDKRPPRWKHR